MASILVIDDESAICEVIARTLAAAGHTVTQAADGRRALDHLRAQPADLVLTDLVMPELDGIETIMALRHLFPALPVIAMSGATGNAGLYLEIAKHLGVRHTLAKPFTAATLLDAINTTLERTCAA
jgi:CheY-like chemotaxis protein